MQCKCETARDPFRKIRQDKQSLLFEVTVSLHKLIKELFCWKRKEKGGNSKTKKTISRVLYTNGGKLVRANSRLRPSLLVLPRWENFSRNSTLKFIILIAGITRKNGKQMFPSVLQLRSISPNAIRWSLYAPTFIFFDTSFCVSCL